MRIRRWREPPGSSSPETEPTGPTATIVAEGSSETKTERPVPAVATPPSVEVLSAGKAPLRTLQWHPEKGLKQRLEIHLDVTMSTQLHRQRTRWLEKIR